MHKQNIGIGAFIDRNAAARECLSLSRDGGIDSPGGARSRGNTTLHSGNGWRWGDQRDDERKIRNLLVPYRRLSEKEKDKDRLNIFNYPQIVALAGYGLVDHTQIAKV